MIQNDFLGSPWAFALAIALLFMGQVVAVVPFTFPSSSLLQGIVVALHPFLLALAVQPFFIGSFSNDNGDGNENVTNLHI